MALVALPIEILRCSRSPALTRYLTNLKEATDVNRGKEVFAIATKLAALLLVAVVILAAFKTRAQETVRQNNKFSAEQWEYLTLAGPTTNAFAQTSDPKMRKEQNGAFAREAIVLEQHLDKLGADGWELIAVGGPPTDPAYYFKRRR